MGINTVIRCSECDKVWRRAECKGGKCPLCTEIGRLKEEKRMLEEEILIRDKEIERLKGILKSEGYDY